MKCIGAWLVCLLALTASGKDYFVDIIGGSDANDGAQLTPYQHAPGDTNATGNAASTVLAGGDAVIFKGGVDYTNTVLLASGGSGNPLVYDGNSAGTFGTGRAIINGQKSTSKLYGFYGAGVSNLVFRSLDITQWGGHGTNAWSCGATTDYNGWGIGLYGSQDILVRDCLFHDLGDWTNSVNMNESHMNGIGVLFNDSAYRNTVTNCDFTQIGMAGIRVQAQAGSKICTNILITASSFHNYIRWGVDIASASANAKMSDIIIDGCTFYDYYQYDSTTWLGCAANWPHTDPIIFRLGNNPPVAGQTLGTVTQPNVVRNCIWYNNTPTQYAAGTAGIFLTTWGGRMLVYNNVFLNVLMHGEGAIYAQDGIDPAASPTALPDYWIANNSFYGDTYCVVLRTLTSPLASFALTNGTVRILNNVFYKTDSGASMPITSGLDAYSSPTQLDYNRYYCPGRVPFGPDVAYILSGGVGSWVNFSGLQAAGYESHGSYGDPLYTDISHGLTNASSNLLTLQNASACRNVATNLGAFFVTDKNGALRGSLWDIGAYSFAGASGPVQLRVTSATFGSSISFK